MTSGHRQNITQGERAISDDPDLVITTLLGSCVACCIWDPIASVGGMNHMLLASKAVVGVGDLVGINEMELLINEVQKHGGNRNRLRAKAFGGARMIAGLSDIGEQNSNFVLEFLAREGIECDGHSLGGVSARHLMFWPASGRVMQRIRSDAPDEVQIVSKPLVQSGNDLELF